MKSKYIILSFLICIFCYIGCNNDNTEVVVGNHNGNFAPNMPSNPSPRDSIILTAGTHVEFSWSGGDPGIGDTVMYDLYYGSSNPPTSTLIQGSLLTTYDLGIPGSGIYYWKVIAKEETGLTTSGPVWRFTISSARYDWPSRRLALLQKAAALFKKYNFEFSEEKYNKFLKDLDSVHGLHIDFRIGESPVFLPKSFKDELIKASEEIIDYIWTDEYQKISLNAIPKGMNVLGDPGFPHMLALDYAICKDAAGNLIPQLIELQGFPSLFYYQELLNIKFHEHFDIPENVTNYFGGLDHESYIQLLKDVIVGNSNPENVILLEIEPEKQKTRIDFVCTKHWLGIDYVCITDVIKEEKNLYYNKNGKKTKIDKIYNRVIFDELLKRTDIKHNFSFNDELDVEWIPHPNWFFRISKFTLPYLKNKYVPETKFLSDFKEYPDDLENYILKPLFSFAGAGVKFDVTKEALESIEDKSNYILQKKIEYVPVIETFDIPAKAELRLLFVHRNGKPRLINNLVRLSKGKMMGVDFNKDKTWVGSSIAYFEK